MCLKGIIFDLDGVLVDAREWHYQALNRALGVFAFEITRSEHDNFYNGLPTWFKLRHLSEKKGFPVGLQEIVSALKKKETERVIRELCVENHELRAKLLTYKEAGFRLAVASNAIRSSVQLMLAKTGILDLFDFFLGNEDVINPKPNPEIYWKAIERMGLVPDEVLIVEDSPHGCQAALDSGAKVCRVEFSRDLVRPLDGDKTILDLFLEEE